MIVEQNQVVWGVSSTSPIPKALLVDENGAIVIKWVLDQNLIWNVKNWYSDKTFGFVFGKRSASVQNAVVDLWDWPTGTYVFPTVWQQMQVVSSSASDTSAGTWGRSVEIHYLDSNYLPQTEIVTMNGTTPVNTVSTDIFRINFVHTTSVGSNGVPVGNISVQNTDGSITYSVIQAGFNVARQAIYTVPDGVNWYISHWQASSGASTGDHFTQITLRATQHFGTQYPWVFLIVDELGCLNGWQSINFPIPVRIPARTDVKISAISDASNANVTALWAIMGWFEAI